MIIAVLPGACHMYPYHTQGTANHVSISLAPVYTIWVAKHSCDWKNGAAWCWLKRGFMGFLWLLNPFFLLLIYYNFLILFLLAGHSGHGCVFVRCPQSHWIYVLELHGHQHGGGVTGRQGPWWGGRSRGQPRPQPRWRCQWSLQGHGSRQPQNGVEPWWEWLHLDWRYQDHRFEGWVGYQVVENSPRTHLHACHWHCWTRRQWRTYGCQQSVTAPSVSLPRVGLPKPNSSATHQASPCAEVFW